MYSKKEKKKMRSRIAEINLRFEELATVIETEKRQMTDAEKEERNALVQEKEILQLRLERSEHNPESQQEISQERAFAQTIAAMHGKCEMPEECRSLVNGVDMDIPTNRDIQDTASATTIIPLTIGDIIQPLEKGLILDKVGLRMQYGLVGAWQFPIVAGVEATIEDENVEVNDTKIDIGKINPSPKRVTIAIPVSNRAIDQSNGALLEIVRKQLPMAIARVLNKCMFSKTKVTPKAFEGCFVNPTTEINATGKAWKDAITLKGAVMKKGVIFDGTPAYVCSATKYAELESTPRDAGSGLMVIENGKINGFPVFITEYIGEGVLGFGVFSYQLVGQFGKMRMTYDPYTGAKKNLVYFVFNSDYDMLTLRPEAFGVLSDTPTT
jgi:HK97 family phage major capsid protein